MNPKEELIKGRYFYLVLTGIFLLILSPVFLSEGMFMDGMMYATMARNLAEGIGTFWQPHCSGTIFPYFINHPPLAIGLESIFFRVIGDNRFAERIYSLTTVLITCFLIVQIWKSLGKSKSSGWLPILFWLSMPSVIWALENNMLENTLGMFVTLSVLFYLKSLRNNRFIFLILSGLSLSLGFLTKGFVTFFPLSFPFFLWLFKENRKIWPVIADTIVVFLSSLLFLAMLYLISPGYRETLPGYLKVTFSLIIDEATKSSRFYILYRLLMELLPVLSVSLMIAVFLRIKKTPMRIERPELLHSAAFLCLGLSGVLPIMLTRVQSAYYLLTSLPFFAISLSLPVFSIIEPIIEKISSASHGFRVFKITAAVMVITGVIMAAFFSRSISRDETIIEDMRSISYVIPESSTVSIMPEMYTNWRLHSYYARYHKITLDAGADARHDFLLINKSLYTDTLSRSFQKVDLKTREFDLFVRKP